MRHCVLSAPWFLVHTPFAATCFLAQPPGLSLLAPSQCHIFVSAAWERPFSYLSSMPSYFEIPWNCWIFYYRHTFLTSKIKSAMWLTFHSLALKVLFKVNHLELCRMSWRSNYFLVSLGVKGHHICFPSAGIDFKLAPCSRPCSVSIYLLSIFHLLDILWDSEDTVVNKHREGLQSQRV